MKYIDFILCEYYKFYETCISEVIYPCQMKLLPCLIGRNTCVKYKNKCDQSHNKCSVRSKYCRKCFALSYKSLETIVNLLGSSETIDYEECIDERILKERIDIEIWKEWKITLCIGPFGTMDLLPIVRFMVIAQLYFPEMITNLTKILDSKEVNTENEEVKQFIENFDVNTNEIPDETTIGKAVLRIFQLDEKYERENSYSNFAYFKKVIFEKIRDTVGCYNSCRDFKDETFFTS